MNSTTQTPTTPQTLRQLAAAAYADKICQEIIQKEKERRLYREHMDTDFNGYLAGIFRQEEKTYQVFCFSWDEEEDAPVAQCDGLTFVPTFADDDTTMNGVALQTEPGRRHRIESLADLGALLPRCKSCGSENVQDTGSHVKCFHCSDEYYTDGSDAPTLAPPMSETHPETDDLPSIYICTSGGVTEVISTSHPIKVYHFDYDEAEADDDYDGEEIDANPHDRPGNDPATRYEAAQAETAERRRR
jgi:hypothetical protein